MSQGQTEMRVAWLYDGWLQFRNFMSLNQFAMQMLRKMQASSTPDCAQSAPQTHCLYLVVTRAFFHVWQLLFVWEPS